MSSTTEQALHRTMVATFEELGLIVPDVALSPTQLASRVDAAVSVAFRGPLSGRLVLRASSAILLELVTNMLGSDEAHDCSMQHDALGELANVICGNLLPQVAGLNTVFVLSAPQWYDDLKNNSEGCTVKASASVGVGDGKAIADLVLFGEGTHTAEFRVAAA